ncbi:MAG: hypothetical protein GEU83_15115 [Pseudonocardiaceae bacterium]|nr:hypothetical protein [Pseudonocardiaceae bacterium]
MAAPRHWRVVLRDPDGRRYPPRDVVEDIDQPGRFRAHLLFIARIEDPENTDRGENWIGRFELEVIDPEAPRIGPVRVLRWEKP